MKSTSGQQEGPQIDKSARPKQPLDYLGGFEKYQEMLYAEIAGRIANLPVRDCLIIEKRLQLRKKGFTNGLVDFIQNPNYITRQMIEPLEVPLNFGELGFIHQRIVLAEEEENYWDSELTQIYHPSFGKKISPKSYLMFKISNDSDKLAKENNSYGIKPDFKYPLM
jgi:hypothetical protein